jgi:tryptophanyl-tRNA synthetase
VGLRDLSQLAETASEHVDKPKTALPQLKQYREQDGKFYFKLISDSGETLLQSLGFDNPKDAGAWVARFKREGGEALGAAEASMEALAADTRVVVVAALDALKHAEDERERAKNA